MSSIIDKIFGSGAPTPGTSDVLGDWVYSQVNGKRVGREVLHSDLAGAWMGFGAGIRKQLDGGLSNPEYRVTEKHDNVVFLFALESDLRYTRTAYGKEVGGEMTGPSPGGGRLWYVAPNYYLIAHDDPIGPNFAGTYYPLLFNKQRDVGAVWLMELTSAANETPPITTETIFHENNFIYKISDDPSVFVDIQASLDEWATP